MIIAKVAAGLTLAIIAVGSSTGKNPRWLNDMFYTDYEGWVRVNQRIAVTLAIIMLVAMAVLVW